MRKILFGALGSALILSCGDMTKSTNASRQKEAWNHANNPSIMDVGFIKEQKYLSKYAELALKPEAKLDTLPWSEDYWANARGGLSYRWNDTRSSEQQRYTYPILTKESLSRVDLKILSPMEKFDIFLGHYDFRHTKLERKRTEILTSSNIPIWTGLCDDWAAASLFYAEPGPVTLKGRNGEMVPFGSSDVKGLLIYFLMEAEVESKFLGSTCDWELDELQRRYKRGLISPNTYRDAISKCSGVNAGAFHIVLTNQIGRLKQGFIMNKVWGTHEIWNQPVFGYSAKEISQKNGRSEGAAPGTVREVEVRTRVDFIEEKDQNWNITSETGVENLDLHYRLELDGKGDIIGGAWYEDSEDRPGFVWKQDIPSFYGSEFEAIKQIYEAAVGKKFPEHNRTPQRSLESQPTAEKEPAPEKPKPRNRLVRFFRR